MPVFTIFMLIRNGEKTQGSKGTYSLNQSDWFLRSGIVNQNDARQQYRMLVTRI